MHTVTLPGVWFLMTHHAGLEGRGTAQQSRDLCTDKALGVDLRDAPVGHCTLALSVEIVDERTVCSRQLASLCADFCSSPDVLTNQSVFSFLHTLTAWHCPHSPAAAAEHRPFSSRSISPAHRAHSSKPAAAGLLLCAHAGTVGHRTVT